MKLPEVCSYGQYSNDNYGVNTIKITVAGLEIYYSYTAIVAFRGNYGLQVIENPWGPTTGKHLNWIDGGDNHARSKRLDRTTFYSLLEEELTQRGIVDVSK